MAQSDYPLTVDDGPDDLPRTFRREKEAREREERERLARERDEPSFSASSGDGFIAPDVSHTSGHDAGYEEEAFPAVVKNFDVPFFRLVLFFIKAAIAAIPAVILFFGLLWLAGDILQRIFPWLVKMQIFIHFPE